MNKKVGLFFLILFIAEVSFTSEKSTEPNIVIRPATLEDIPSAVQLDERVCSEYFKPLFVEHYPNTLGEDPDRYLSLDLDFDREKLFPQCVNHVGNERLWVAFDEECKQVAGLIVAHQDDTGIAEIDLLLVDKTYRNQGLGKRLIADALASFPRVKHHIVYVFSHNYSALEFYKRLGFVVIGPGPENRQTIYGFSFAELFVYCKRNNK